MRVVSLFILMISLNTFANPVLNMIEEREFSSLNTYLESNTITSKEAYEALALINKKSMDSLEYMDVETIQRLRKFTSI